MKQRILRLLALAAALPLAVALAGCAGPGPDAGVTQAPYTPQPAEAAAPSAEAAAPSAEPAAPSAEAPAEAAAPSDDWWADAGALTAKDVHARATSGDGAVRLLAVNVGKGDALVLRAGDYVCLIDAGRNYSLGRVTEALAMMGVSEADGKTRLDAAFLTHTDGDHAGGLAGLARGFGAHPELRVDNWYAPAMYTGVKAEKHPAAVAAGACGQAVNWLERGDVIPLGDTGAALRVLAPAHLFTDKDDNNSLVMMLESPQGKILFTGDMELPEEADLLSFGDDLKCDVLKVPNHGDDDTTGEVFARAAGARLAVISTDSAEKASTPDPGVVARLQAAGSRVVVTQQAEMGLLVTLAGGEVTVEDVGIERPEVSGLSIAEVDAGDDRIVLRNDSGAPVDLTGFALVSDPGSEMYVFAGRRIDPGATLTVGTRSTEGECDVLWDDKKVIHRKKTDTIRLYDGFSRLVDEMDNGL